jgi:hypothetical protein
MIIVLIFTMPITKVDDEGKEYQADDELHVRFHMGRNFARAYYRDEMKAKGLNPDFQIINSMMITQKEIQNTTMMRVHVINFWVSVHLQMMINLSLHLKQNGKKILDFG